MFLSLPYQVETVTTIIRFITENRPQLWSSGPSVGIFFLKQA